MAATAARHAPKVDHAARHYQPGFAVILTYEAKPFPLMTAKPSLFINLLFLRQ
jgi:hypothetical protein